MKWTETQKQIINNRKGTMLVSAAAGSGKTAVLVQRILEWVVTDGRDIDEFLVVTFTRAAAAQMRNKIRDAFEALQEQQPENQHIVKQLSLIHRANITTIDRFCKELVNEHFQTLAIDPSMRIMDETEVKLMQEDVLEQVLEQAYAEESDAMLALHQYMNDMRSDTNIRNLLRKVQRQADSVPYPEQWIEEAKRDAQIWKPEELEQQPWMRILVAEIQSVLEEVRELPERIAAEYRCLSPEYRPKAYDKYCTYFEEECRMLEEVWQASTYSELLHAFDSSRRVYKRFIWKNTGVPESHYLTELWESYVRIKKEVLSRLGASLSEIQEQQQGVRPILLTVLELAGRFMAEYQKEKRIKNCMDFSDVEHYALQVLVNRQEDGSLIYTEAAEQLRKRYVEILIDEYQDSNDLQEAILTSIARREDMEYTNMFMVGDIKQSIYRFRMARPQLFQRKYECFTDNVDSGAAAVRVELKQNFRSRAAVLEAVNLFFYQLMSKSLGGIDYDAQVALIPGRSFEEQEEASDYRTEVLFLDTITQLEGEEAEDEPDREGNQAAQEEISEEREEQNKVEMEARMVAARIHALCDSVSPLQVWDDGSQSYRPCRYRDVVILLRTVKGWSEIFSRVLSDAGIPVYAESGKGYFDSVEVKNLLCMLAVIDNARDDIALAGVLNSPMVSVTDEELAQMRSECRRGDLWTVLHNYVTLENAKPELKERLSEFFCRLEHWKHQRTYSTIRELIWSILDVTGYYEYVGAMPNGQRRQGNIQKLIEKASSYENTSYHGLFDFLRYIERMKITEQDFGEAVVLGANDDLVRIMTIHKSKGLEFPVVILSGCGKHFHQKDAEDTILVDPDCYLAVNYKHLNEHYYEKTEKRNCLARHMKEENLAEELRILYVAMTRAQEKLIMTGVVDNQMAKKNEEYHLLWDRYFSEKTGKGEVVDAIHNLPALGKYRVGKSASYLSWFVSCIAAIQNRKLQQDCLDYRIVTSDELDIQAVEELSRLWERKALWQQRTSFVSSETTAEEVRRRFQWHYSHPQASTRTGKLSVSEIKKMSQIVDEEEASQSVSHYYTGEQKESAGAAYGTLVHLVMEKISFVNKGNLEQVEQALRELWQNQILDKEELELISAEKIHHMINSTLGVRMGRAEQAGRLYREQQFIIGIPMNQIYPDTDEKDLELVQGIIDAYFEEDGELVLMDYKTDRVSKEQGAEELIRRYQAQLQYYKRTLEQLTGKQVKETYIYSFFLEAVIPILI